MRRSSLRARTRPDKIGAAHFVRRCNKGRPKALFKRVVALDESHIPRSALIYTIRYVSMRGDDKGPEENGSLFGESCINAICIANICVDV